MVRPIEQRWNNANITDNDKNREGFCDMAETQTTAGDMLFLTFRRPFALLLTLLDRGRVTIGVAGITLLLTEGTAEKAWNQG